MYQWSSLTDAYLDVEDGMLDESIDAKQFYRLLTIVEKRNAFAMSKGVPSIFDFWFD